MFTIIGVKLTSFTTKDGTKVTGYNVFVTEERSDVAGWPLTVSLFLTGFAIALISPLTLAILSSISLITSSAD